eukprot:CAMPEP_0171809886 /NCGR_PEP_ID=MMETSP0991-20121206/77200_1 /TAXON_ID=483369 /ORGANISM="non described non described, Strain CCMP2098" /LENGTH=66 /DNA_ID=CAMNT_0012422989 /DNA_START=541 /DNA_END=741 /DNA_ORIENTATION=+
MPEHHSKGDLVAPGGCNPKCSGIVPGESKGSIIHYGERQANSYQEEAHLGQPHAEADSRVWQHFSS